jgi:hypothetical protein
MSKRKQTPKRAAPAAAPRTQSDAQRQVPGAAQTARAGAPASATRRSPPMTAIVIGAVALALVLTGGVYWYWQSSRGSSVATLSSTPQAPLAGGAAGGDAGSGKYTFGGAARCASNPPFVQTFGFDPQLAALSTSERRVRGLALVEIGPRGDVSQKGRIFAHPSWNRGGHLGPISRTGNGAVYAGPVPVISVYYNETARQNDLYRVDPVTGVMTRVLTLPAAQVPDGTNPHGILGLALDCDTNSLYVSSVLGSTRDREVGRLFRVDLNTNTIVGMFDGIDAIGMGIFNGTNGKRLYVGRARNSKIESIALDDAGNFKGGVRPELNLEGMGPRGDDRARRISFSVDNVMQVQGIEFGFNLIAPTEKQETQYRFRYDTALDRWVEVAVQR